MAALVVVAMVQGHGGSVGPSEFDNGYLRAHLVPVLDLMGRSLADWSSTLMVMRDWLSLWFGNFVVDVWLSVGGNLKKELEGERWEVWETEEGEDCEMGSREERIAKWGQGRLDLLSARMGASCVSIIQPALVSWAKG